MSPRAKSPFDLEYALLGLLRDGPLHAYELHRRLQETEVMRLIWCLKQRQVYALLERLEEEGYLVSTIEVQDNRPPKRMLRLTNSGEVVFSHWLSTPVGHGRDFRQQFLAKLFFARQAGPTVLAALLARQQAVYQQQLGDFQRQLAAVPPECPLDRLVLQFRIGQLEAILVWLDTCGATLLVPEPTAPA